MYLVKHKEELEQKLLLVQSRSTIKEYATNTLDMEKIKLRDIKHLASAHG